MDIAQLLSQIAHTAVGLALAWLVLRGYRWVRRQSDVLGLVLALGILARLVVGMALFWISYLELPIAQSLQAGGGFWLIAVDATRYYTDAITAIQTGLFDTNYENFPSPFFVRVLAVWLLAVGISPASALLLNACVYVAVVVLIVRMFAPVNDWRRDLPGIAGVAAYSFWPAIFVHGTQPLKDDIFFALIAVVCLALLGIFRLIVYGRRLRGGRASLAAAAAAVMAGTFGLAGIRWYFPLIMCGSLVVVFAIFALRGRSTPLPAYLGGSLAVVVAVWIAAGGLTNFASQFLFPAGGQGPLTMVRSVTDIPSVLAAMTQMARTGFLLTGGDSNIVVPMRKDGDSAKAGGVPETLATVTPGRLRAAPGEGVPGTGGALSEEQADALLAIPRNRSEHVKTMVVGLAIIFVPISVLKALSVVEFTGGRGFLPVADLDTLFQDAALVCLFALLWTRRREIGTRMPFVVFCVVLAGTTAALLGYVVTNYGTLFRMRPMMAIPICVVMVGLSSRHARTERAEGTGRRRTERTGRTKRTESNERDDWGERGQREGTA